MRQQIAAGVSQGKSDQQILDQLAAEYGADTLLTPSFHGFNTLLWIVPVTLAFFAVGITFIVQKRRTTQSKA